jgi:hypothetical protein
MTVRTARTAPLVLCTVLALAGCGSVDGTATPGGPVAAGPLTAVQAQTELLQGPGEDSGEPDVSAFGHGGAYVVVPATDSAPPQLITVDPAGHGLGEVRTTELPQVRYVDNLHATRDGRAIVIGSVTAPDGTSPTYGVAVLDPTSGAGPVYELLSEDESEVTVESVVSGDGRTLFAVQSVQTGLDEFARRLVTVDLATGAMETRPFELETQYGRPEGLVLAPDGTLTVERVVPTERDVTVQLLRFGPDLAPRGEPVVLTEPVIGPEAHGLAVTDDGTVLALVRDDVTRLVALPPDADRPEVVTEDLGSHSAMAADPTGDWAYAADKDGFPVAIDLSTGEVGEPVPLCDDGGDAETEALRMADGGGSLLAVGYCEDGPLTLWRLGAAQ